MEQPLRMQASSSYEPYSYEQNGPALIGNVGRWLDTDDFLGEWPKQGSSAAEDDNSWLVEFPRGWPSVFKESAALRTLVNKKLRGTRCRAVEPATAADRAAAKALTLRPLHSFDNALALSETRLALSLLDEDSCVDGATFVYDLGALNHAPPGLSPLQPQQPTVASSPEPSVVLHIDAVCRLAWLGDFLLRTPQVRERSSLCRTHLYSPRPHHETPLDAL